MTSSRGMMLDSAHNPLRVMERVYRHCSFLCLSVLIALFLLAGCSAPQATQGQITVTIKADGDSRQAMVSPGSTVEEVLNYLNVDIHPLDRSEPPLFTVLTEGSEARLIRVEEEFSNERVVIPFEQQVIRSETLTEGETKLIQPGENGLQEITYRRLLEEGVEISYEPVKTVMVTETIPEIVLVGSRDFFKPISIPGRLAYLSGGNAWVMERTTGNRRPVVTTGDLDGRIFSLSPDGEWLLFTRQTDDDEVINTLWTTSVDEGTEVIIDLGIPNVVHFAEWSPTAPRTIAYSTVEPRSTAPGWQANNDLALINFYESGGVSASRPLLEANSGGIYGWWGTTFVWSPKGDRMGYARPDGVGIVDLQEKESQPLRKVTPLQTKSDWAWVPDLIWGPDGAVFYSVDHAPPESVVSPEESPLFDLLAIPLLGGEPIILTPKVGMFSFPSPSPAESLRTGERSYRLAYLQSVFPTQSDSSRYQLVVMDRDGSNRRILFPLAGELGLKPQRVVWSPEPLVVDENAALPGYLIGFVYQGDLWLLDVDSGETWQLTGDGLTGKIDWQ